MSIDDIRPILTELGEGLARYHKKNEYGDNFDGEVYEIKVELDNRCNLSKKQIVQKLNEITTKTSLVPYSFLIVDQKKNLNLYCISMSKDSYPGWKLTKLWK